MRSFNESLHHPNGLLLIAFAFVMIEIKVLPAQTPPDSVRLISEDTSTSARFNRLMASVQRVGLPTARPDRALTAQHFMLVDVRPLLVGQNRMLLDGALQRHEREIVAWRTSLQSHGSLRDALASRNVPMSQVIAIDALTSAGHATVYYLPPP